MGCLWGVTQLFGYKNVLLKNIGISTLVEFGWSLGGVWVELFMLKNRFESVSNQQLCY